MPTDMELRFTRGDASRFIPMITSFALVTGLVLGPAPSLGSTVTTESEASSQTEDEDEEPMAQQEDSLVVETSLPFAPSSNTVATKLPTPLEWTPANVGVVEGDTLDQQGARILGDALDNVSGVNAQTGNGVFDLFVVRGFESTTGALVLTDGAPEPEATFYQTYNVERVEVFKGPAGFLYGANPLASAVNIVRKQPVPTDFGRVYLSGGSFDTYEGQIDLNYGNEKAAFRLNGLYRESEGYRDGRDSEVTGLNPSVTWWASDRTTFNLNVELLTSDFTPDAGLPLVQGELPDVPRERSYAAPGDFSEQDVERYQLDFEHRFSDRAKLRNKTYYRELDWQTQGTLLAGVFPNPFVPGRQLVIRTQTELDDRQRLLGNQLEGVFSAQTGSISHEIVVGLELSRYSDTFALGVGLIPPLDLEDPMETEPPPVQPIPGQGATGDSDTDVLAPYVIDQIRLSDAWQVLLGARFDRIEFEDSVRGDVREDDELSPMLGVVFAPTERLTVYANAGQAFAPPSARVSGERKPEESTQYELGLRQRFLEDRLGLTVAVYEITRDNIAIPDDNGFTQQAGDQRSRGLEIELSGRLPGEVDALLSYAYNDSELTRFAEIVPTGTFPPFIVLDHSGNTAPLAPEHLANLWFHRRFGPVDVGLGARYVDSQYLSADNSAEIDGYGLLDASVIYNLSRWRFSLFLDNLTDTEFETRGFGSSSVIPGTPLAARVGVEYRF